MKVIDPGHLYSLGILDGEGDVALRFVKRVGDKYPGNNSYYPGTTTQEVLRALIDRIKYVDGQIPDYRNEEVLYNLRVAIWYLEIRAADRHGRLADFGREFAGKLDKIETFPTCPKCFHIGCKGNCHD